MASISEGECVAWASAATPETVSASASGVGAVTAAVACSAKEAYLLHWHLERSVRVICSNITSLSSQKADV